MENTEKNSVSYTVTYGWQEGDGWEQSWDYEEEEGRKSFENIKLMKINEAQHLIDFHWRVIKSRLDDVQYIELQKVTVPADDDGDLCLEKTEFETLEYITFTYRELIEARTTEEEE